MAPDFLGAFSRPDDYEALGKAEKRSWAKRVADSMRERAGLMPTNDDGGAPQESPDPEDLAARQRRVTGSGPGAT
jgi:hypothetical protein